MALWRRKKVPEISREQALTARPQQNPNVTGHETDAGLIRVNVPFKPRVGARWLTWLLVTPQNRNFALDEIGSEVWRLCDGEHTVKDVADAVARRYKVNRREAEQSAIQYMRMLMQRGLVLMEIDRKKGNADG
jgi:coenzyme PQQ synthesis protein D (PqqD)